MKKRERPKPPFLQSTELKKAGGFLKSHDSSHRGAPNISFSPDPAISPAKVGDNMFAFIMNGSPTDLGTHNEPVESVGQIYSGSQTPSLVELQPSPRVDRGLPSESNAENILRKLELTTGKRIHSQFYNKLQGLTEKINLYKQVFYTRQPKFDKLTQRQIEKMENNRQQIILEREQIRKKYAEREHKKQVQDYGMLIQSKLAGFKKETIYQRGETKQQFQMEFDLIQIEKQRSPRYQKEYSIALQHGVSQHIQRQEINISEGEYYHKTQQIKQILSKNKSERESAFAEIKQMKKLDSYRKLGIQNRPIPTRNTQMNVSIPFLKAGSSTRHLQSSQMVNPSEYGFGTYKKKSLDGSTQEIKLSEILNQFDNLKKQSISSLDEQGTASLKSISPAPMNSAKQSIKRLKVDRYEKLYSPVKKSKSRPRAVYDSSDYVTSSSKNLPNIQNQRGSFNLIDKDPAQLQFENFKKQQRLQDKIRRNSMVEMPTEESIQNEIIKDQRKIKIKVKNRLQQIRIRKSMANQQIKLPKMYV